MVVVLMLSVAATMAQKDRITIYVSGPIRNGFVDTTQDVEDSIEDIRNRFKEMKDLRLVDFREEADINLTVVTRGVGREVFGQRLSYTEYYNQRTVSVEIESLPIMANTFWVASVLEVGEYRKEFLVYDPQQEDSLNWGVWGGLATRIANDVKAWAVANREFLQ